MISSLTNNSVKYVRRLQNERRFRQHERAFVAEGTRWLREVLSSDIVPALVLFTEAWRQGDDHAEMIEILPRLGVPYQAVTEAVMGAMSDTESPPGVLLVLPQQTRPLPLHPTYLLILDAIQTPGNLGTMLRTAAAAGVEGALLAPGCVDAYNPKVVRGAMGAHLRLPIQELDWSAIGQRVAGLVVWTAEVSGGVAYTAVNWQQPSALIIGSEAQGVSVAAQAVAQGRVTIPMHAQTESLNAAVATGILLFEAARQRG